MNNLEGKKAKNKYMYLSRIRPVNLRTYFNGKKKKNDNNIVMINILLPFQVLFQFQQL